MMIIFRLTNLIHFTLYHCPSNVGILSCKEARKYIHILFSTKYDKFFYFIIVFQYLPKILRNTCIQIIKNDSVRINANQNFSKEVVLFLQNHVVFIKYKDVV